MFAFFFFFISMTTWNGDPHRDHQSCSQAVNWLTQVNNIIFMRTYFQHSTNLNLIMITNMFYDVSSIQWESLVICFRYCFSHTLCFMTVVSRRCSVRKIVMEASLSWMVVIPKIFCCCLFFLMMYSWLFLYTYHI